MHRRVLLREDPLLNWKTYSFMASPWPARWIGPAVHSPETSQALAFRRQFRLTRSTKLRIHVSADQRYELYVDGQRLGRGPERGDLLNWFYESWDLDLSAGPHVIVARVWWIAPSAPAPEAQMTVQPGFLLFAEDEGNELLSTGVAPWQYKPLPAYQFVNDHRHHCYFADGAVLHINAARLDPNLTQGTGTNWKTPKVVSAASLAAAVWESSPWWLLRPAILPPMYEKKLQLGLARHVQQVPNEKTYNLRIQSAANLPRELQQWNALLQGKKSLTIPPRTRRRIIIDLQDYYCAYPLIQLRGGRGALLRAQFAESLYSWPDETKDPRNGHSPKANRDLIEGKIFFGVGGQILCDGQPALFESHQWMAGRYLEIYIQTAGKPLTLEYVAFEETHYPFRFRHRFTSANPGLNRVIPVALRTLEMCSHETSMDCPYYERLNYVGDTRLQALVAYAASGDDRLARKCIQLFDWSRTPSGLTRSRHPSRTVQTIPPFSLWWIGMVHDYALWRRDPGFVTQRMPGVRAICEFWRSRLADNGLLLSPPGWNFVDWVPAWPKGIAPGGEGGFSAPLNLQAILVLRLAAELEDLQGETILARRHRNFARALFTAVQKHYYLPAKGLFADDLAHQRFSEHAQCLAVLSGQLSATQSRRLVQSMLTTTQPLEKTTIYFTHYLFEALRQVGQIAPLLKRLDLWRQLHDFGFKTTFEAPEPSRSDCHAWAAHPVFHYHASLAGIRPAAWSFARVRITPQLGHLATLTGQMPHPDGLIQYDLRHADGNLQGKITLPPGLSGELVLPGKVQRLAPGINQVKTAR